MVLGEDSRSTALKHLPIEHHRFDGFPDGEVPQFRVLVGGLVDHVANTEFIKHARHKPEMIEDLRTVQWRLWREVRAVRVAHSLLLYRGDCSGT